jgi:hypothetical protein
MEYRKPEIAVCTEAIRAIQGNKNDPLHVDSINPMFPETTAAYQADE